MQLLLHNIDRILTGRFESPTLDAAAIVVEDGRIASFDAAAAADPQVVIDCQQMTVAPGLVDTHVHPTLGDYAPKQQSVGWLERMVHGGVTRVFSAGEVHVAGRSGAESSLAIALAAHHSFRGSAGGVQPSGMRVHGGAMLLEKDTEDGHIDRARAAGMEIIGEVGIGSLKDPARSGELSAHARSLGMTVHMHCGCTSDRGPGGDEHPHFSAEDVLEVRPTIASHANTFASLSDSDIDRLCAEDGPPHVEVVQAGGTRSMLRVVEGLAERGALDRLLIGTDTPTGYGVASLGVLKTVGDVCSLAGVAPELSWAIASGQGARAFGVAGNVIEVGAPADLVVMDASLGSVCDSAVEAIAAGEFPGIAAVITDGRVRVEGSLCTLRSRRIAGIETVR